MLQAVMQPVLATSDNFKTIQWQLVECCCNIFSLEMYTMQGLILILFCFVNLIRHDVYAEILHIAMSFKLYDTHPNLFVNPF